MVVRSTNVRDMGTEMTRDGSRELSRTTTTSAAWGEAEHAKYMARYKREEAKIQAWEDDERTKAEMEVLLHLTFNNKPVGTESTLTFSWNRLAAARRIAEENHAKAGARLNGKTVKTIFIRQIGYLPSFFFLFLIFWVTGECRNHYMRVHWVNPIL